METELALPSPPSSLSHRLALVSVRARGVGPEQLRWIATDPEIFEAFYREHVEVIQGFLARRVGDREHAADLTAEVFLAAIGASHRYRSARGAPKTWLYGIARTVVVICRRRIAREVARDERLRASALLDEDDALRMDARLNAAAQSRRLYAATDRLPDAEQAVLELVALDELSVVEAAAAARVRPLIARLRLLRARRKLRAELEAAATPQTPKRGSTIVNRHRHPTAGFEDRLLGGLRALVAERGAAAAAKTEASTGTSARRRGPRLTLALVPAGAAVAAAATAALIVPASDGDTPAAYAVEPQPKGMVNVEIRGLEDAKGLEEALRDAGIPASVTYLPTGMACKEPRFRPAPPRDDRTVVLIGHVDTSGPGREGVPIAFRISRDAVGPGQTLLITASPEAEGSAVRAEIAERSVAPCKPVLAPPNGDSRNGG